VFVFFQNMAKKYITYTYPLLFPAALLLGRYLAVRQKPAPGKQSQNIYKSIIINDIVTGVFGNSSPQQVMRSQKSFL